MHEQIAVGSARVERCRSSIAPPSKMRRRSTQRQGEYTELDAEVGCGMTGVPDSAAIMSGKTAWLAGWQASGAPGWLSNWNCSARPTFLGFQSARQLVSEVDSV